MNPIDTSLPRSPADATVRYTYRVSRSESDVYVECIELEAAGEGRTKEEAVESLREALREMLTSSDAVAPPPSPSEHHIVLVEAAP